MSGGSHIRAIGPGSSAAAQDGTTSVADEPLTLDESWEESAPVEEYWEVPTPHGSRAWIVPALAIFAAVAWTGFFGWAQRAELAAGITPQAGSALVVSWAVPVLLIVALVLLALRLSTREAGRFTDAALTLRQESEALEARLSVVNRELSLAREFLGAQSREVESLGRVATQRISEHADRLQSLVHTNGAQVDALASVSRTALDNMERLRDDLPVIANAARDVSNGIGAAGNTAHSHLGELVAGFNRLNEFGQASERQVAALRSKVDAAIAGFEAQAAQLDQITGTRFAALREKSDVFRAELDGREVEALAAMRHRADRLREEIGSAAQELENHEGELLRSLQARTTAIRDGADTISASLGAAESAALDKWRERIEALKADLEAAIRHVEAIDNAAKVGAQQRLGIIRDEATLVDAKLTESHAIFVTEIEKRRAEATLLATEHAATIETRLAELDAAISERQAIQDERTREMIAAAEVHLARIDDAVAERDRAHGTRVQELAGAVTSQLAALDADIADRRAAQDAQARELAAAVSAHLAELDGALNERRDAQDARSRELAESGARLSAQLDALAAQMTAAADQGLAAEAALASAIDALGERLGASRTALGDTDRAVVELTDASVRLLELIRASAEHSRVDLPAALTETEARLAALGEQGQALGLMLTGAGDRSREVSDYVLAAQRNSHAAMDEIGELQLRVSAAHEAEVSRVAALRSELAQLAQESEALAGQAQGSLRDAITQLEGSARAAITALEAEADTRIASLAERIAGDTNDALDRAMRERVGAALGELEGNAARAAGAGREAAVQLRDQLAKVSELAGNLETRVATARQQAEEQVDGDFSRRVAMITESLNSNAIDIARALSSEVTDTAWASYLRGDRGIFTRRAVRLLEPTEAREVAELYDANGDFREHVNRYIHDFEGMLRTMLSTRDGHAIGVTLLSSDMGKLYVALAQGIERLRD
ncbi:ATPase [Tsuneonella sp. HG094]